jgi:hypothetical protein
MMNAKVKIYGGRKNAQDPDESRKSENQGPKIKTPAAACRRFDWPGPPERKRTKPDLKW